MDAYSQFESNLQEMIALGIVAIVGWLILQAAIALFTRKD